MLLGLTLSVVSAAIVMGQANAASHAGSSKLMVHIPHSLYKDEGYRHREAMFGVPQYGGSISQNVFYAASDLCSPNSFDPTKGYPQRDVGKDGIMTNPFILMVDKGGCSFVSKVRNAQHSGAAAVLIANTDCICGDRDCHSEGIYCDSEEPSMADDGSGSDISIPAFLIFKQDADRLKEQLTQNVPVVAEMAWSLPTPSGERVQYDLWTVPTDVISRDFFLSARDMVIGLGDSVQFTPHMYLLNGTSNACQYNTNGERWCDRGCTNKGRYCALDPDHDVNRGISGADVVKESLRRVCIWNHYKDLGNNGLEWWSYVIEFTSRCDTPERFMDDRCVADAYRYSRVDDSIVDDCIKNSGGLEGDVPNAMLDEEVKQSQGIVVFPTLLVNNVELRGSLTLKNAFSAICAGFAMGAEPHVCQACSNCYSVDACLDMGGVCPGGAATASRGGGGVSRVTFVLSLLFVMGGFGALGYWYYKKSREEMRDRVRDILAEYMPLEDQEVTTGPEMGVGFAMQPEN